MKNKTAVIILAGGKGNRLPGNEKKQYRLLDGKPVLYYSVKRFYEAGYRNICLVTGEGEEEEQRLFYENLFGKGVFSHVVAGGKERTDSVYHGLLALEETKPERVLIHDSARPFVSEEVIRRVEERLCEVMAVSPAVPLSDTVKRVDASGMVTENLPRENLLAVQTPQGFDYALIREAYDAFRKDPHPVTDDGALIEIYTKENHYLVEGDPKNRKLTVPDDMIYAEFLIKRGGV